MLLLLLLLMLTGVFEATTGLPDGSAAVETPFRVTRVEKENVGEVIRTRLMFEGPPTPTILLGDDDNLRTREPSGPGVLEFDTPLHPAAHESVTFIFPDRQYKISLSLSEDARSMDIPRVIHSLQPGNNIQLLPDQPLNVAFAAAVEGIGNGTLEPSRVEVLIASSTEDNTIYRYKTFTSHLSERFPYYQDDHLPVDLEQLVQVNGDRHMTMTVLTRKAGWHFTAGVVKLTLSLRFSCYDNCLVSHVLDTRTVRFYPQGRVGPFPRGFLGFVHNPPNDDSGVSSTHTSCAANYDDCNIVCEAMGDELTLVDVTRMTSASSSSAQGAQGAQLDELRLVSGDWGMSVVRVPDVSFQDAGEFRCRATSLFRSVSETLTLGVLQRVTIDREATTFTNQANGLKMFTCVANGLPAPNISLVDFTTKPSRRYTPLVTHPTQTQTRAQMVIKVADPLADIVGVRCEAKNADGSGLSTTTFADAYYYYYRD